MLPSPPRGSTAVYSAMLSPCSAPVNRQVWLIRAMRVAPLIPPKISSTLPSIVNCPVARSSTRNPPCVRTNVLTFGVIFQRCNRDVGRTYAPDESRIQSRASGDQRSTLDPGLLTNAPRYGSFMLHIRRQQQSTQSADMP